MNPELLEYAQRLGIFLPEGKPKPRRKPRGPKRGEGGRPRKRCGHDPEKRYRRVDRTGKVRTECRPCATIRQRERHRRLNPGWENNKRRPAEVF